MNAHRKALSILLSALSLTLVLGALAPSARAQAGGAPPTDGDTPTGDEAPADATPAPADGPSADDMAKAKEHFLKGKELFDAKDFENAVNEFKESYKLSKNAVLLYNIAFTHDEIGDTELAIFYYEKFLKDTDAGAANRDVAKTRLRQLKKTAGSTDAGSEIQSVTSFQHTIVDEAPPGKPLDITAVIPEGVPWIVTLYYRPAGEVKFTAVDMHHRYSEVVGRIPASVTTAKNIQYYIEVKDGSGKTLERSGEPASPNIVYIDEDAKARFYPDLVPGTTTTTATTSSTGSSSSTGSATTPSGDGSWTDVQSSKFEKLKWGTTGGAAALVLLSGTFYLLSSSAASDLESDSVASRTEDCLMGNPCRSFSQRQKDLQSRGQTYETLGTVTLGISAAAMVAAGYLWYLDLTGDDAKKGDDSVSALPVVGNDYFGAAATLRF